MKRREIRSSSSPSSRSSASFGEVPSRFGSARCASESAGTILVSAREWSNNATNPLQYVRNRNVISADNRIHVAIFRSNILHCNIDIRCSVDADVLLIVAVRLDRVETVESTLLDIEFLNQENASRSFVRSNSNDKLSP